MDSCQKGTDGFIAPSSWRVIDPVALLLSSGVHPFPSPPWVLIPVFSWRPLIPTPRATGLFLNSRTASCSFLAWFFYSYLENFISWSMQSFMWPACCTEGRRKAWCDFDAVQKHNEILLINFTCFDIPPHCLISLIFPVCFYDKLSLVLAMDLNFAM